MKDKVLKFVEYLKENAMPSKGEIDSVLKNLQTRLKKLFPQEDSQSGDEIQKFKKNPNKESLQSLGAELHSIDLSKYTKITHSLTLKFSCEDGEGRYLYDYLFSINLEKLKKSAQAQTATAGQGQTQGQGQKEKESEQEIPIEICKVIVKKYDEEDFALLGQVEELEQKIDEIDEKFIIKMKNEIDDKTQTQGQDEGEEDDFEIVLK